MDRACSLCDAALQSSGSISQAAGHLDAGRRHTCHFVASVLCTHADLGRTLSQEYQLSYDMAEAERCLRALAVPFFHHELVKQMLLSAIEAPQHSQALLGLLEKLSASGEVSESQTAQVSGRCLI